MNCAQVKEQLVDFLYDELPASARTAFADHLRGCPGCSAEVAGYQQTLGQTRRALTGPLLEDPPARVHAAVLAAANAAAEKTRTGEREPEPGFLARFWRTPWLLPAFGAVSVATVVFLVRVLKNPEVIPGQERRSIDERAVVTPIPKVAPTPAPLAEEPVAAPAAGAAEGAMPEEEAAKVRVGAKARGHGGKRAAKLGAKGEAPAFETARPKPGLDLDSPLGGLRRRAGGAGRFAEPPPPRPAAKASRSIDDLLGEVGSARKPASAPAEEITEPTSRPSGFAAQPAPMAAPAPAPAAPPMPSAVSAPARAAAPASRERRRMEMEEDMAPAESAAEPAEKQLAKDKAPATKGGPSLDESVRKADRLFANGEWSAAAAVYRDLLNRFPSYKDAPKWRERMHQSLVAVETARKASDAKASKAAKAKTTDTLLKEMK